MCDSLEALHMWGSGVFFGNIPVLPDSDKIHDYASGLESPVIEGESPVAESHGSVLRAPQVPRDTRNPVGIHEDHLIRLNTSWQPIVNQYREGKVKRTPVRGVQ